MPQLSGGTRKAAKQLHCEWCDEPIAVGESHIWWVWASDGRATTLRTHLECNRPLYESAADDPDHEYCYEGHARGATCEDRR